jgi:hypothetical protein
VFSSPAGFNMQLAAWLQVANRRVHRTLEARPADRWEADRAAMLPLPPTAPPRWWQTCKTKREITRCLKRYVIREVYHLIRPAPATS